jgi:hypothetical protein
LPISARLSVSPSSSEPANVHADALGFALDAGLHVILGIAATDAEAFLYAVAVTPGNPGAVAVSLAVAPGNVAAVGPD